VVYPDDRLDVVLSPPSDVHYGLDAVTEGAESEVGLVRVYCSGEVESRERELVSREEFWVRLRRRGDDPYGPSETVECVVVGLCEKL
jgi:hypothetical protein